MEIRKPPEILLNVKILSDSEEELKNRSLESLITCVHSIKSLLTFFNKLNDWTVQKIVDAKIYKICQEAFLADRVEGKLSDSINGLSTLEFEIKQRLEFMQPSLTLPLTYAEMANSVEKTLKAGKLN